MRRNRLVFNPLLVLACAAPGILIYRWHDWVTPVTGITLGLSGAFVIRRLAPHLIGRLRPLPNIQ